MQLTRSLELALCFTSVSGYMTMPYSLPILLKVLFSLATAGIPLGLAIRKDLGRDAKRRAQLDSAKLRFELWEKRLSLGEATLTGEDLSSLRHEVWQAVEGIWQEANANLDILAEQEREPVVIVGISWWKKALFIYEPIYSASEYVTRFAYAAWLAVLIVFVTLCIEGVWMYFHEPSAKKVIDVQFFHSSKGHATIALLFLIFGI